MRGVETRHDRTAWVASEPSHCHDDDLAPHHSVTVMMFQTGSAANRGCINVGSPDDPRRLQCCSLHQQLGGCGCRTERCDEWGSPAKLELNIELEINSLF